MKQRDASRGRDCRLDEAAHATYSARVVAARRKRLGLVGGGACTVCGRSAIRRDELGRCRLVACRSREPLAPPPPRRPVLRHTCEVCGRHLKNAAASVCGSKTGRKCCLRRVELGAGAQGRPGAPGGAS